MTHQYNTTTYYKGDFQDALASIKQNITKSINSIKTDINSIKSDISSIKTNLKDEISNLKDVIIKRLQNENATLREWCSKLEQKLVVFESSTNNLQQCGRRNIIVISGIPDSVDINHILSDIEVKVISNDIEACHTNGKKNNRINITKTIIRFVNRKRAKKSQNHKNYSFSTNNNPPFLLIRTGSKNEQITSLSRKKT